MHSDATAAIGITWRRGMGRIKHLDVLDLWVQEKFNSKAATIDKVLGADHPADLHTKCTNRAVLVQAINNMGFREAYRPARQAFSSRKLFTTILKDLMQLVCASSIAPRHLTLYGIQDCYISSISLAFTVLHGQLLTACICPKKS